MSRHFSKNVERQPYTVRDLGLGVGKCFQVVPAQELLLKAQKLGKTLSPKELRGSTWWLNGKTLVVIHEGVSSFWELVDPVKQEVRS